MTQVVAGAWIPSDQTFGARLALIRQRMGWGNVAEAARACGIPVETWRGWEMKTDTSLPHNVVQRAQAIADKTGVDYFWLLTGQSAAGPDGGGALDEDVKSPAMVRHQGLEPRTRWFGAAPWSMPARLPAVA